MPFSKDTLPHPEPFVPPGTDLTSFSGFVLNIDHLLASELVAIGTAEECWAALLLWCRAWKQTPAGSLPNDERVLASFSGAGRRWPKVREMALHGFVLCSDGRLYHRFLCAEVMRTRTKQTAYQAERERVAEWRAKRRANGSDTRTVRVQNGDENGTVRDPYTSTYTGTDTYTGTGTRKKKPNGSFFHEDLPIDPNGSISLTAEAARARKPSVHNDFEAFWAAYPRKVGKKAARQKYEIARRDAHADTLLDAAKRYADAAEASDDKRFIAHPATWLHQGRWQDEDVEVQRRRQTPLEALYEGAMRAADELTERQRREEPGDLSQGGSPAQPLLDRR